MSQFVCRIGVIHKGFAALGVNQGFMKICLRGGGFWKVTEKNKSGPVGQDVPCHPVTGQNTDCPGTWVI